MNIKTLVLGDYEVNCYILWEDSSDGCVVIDPGYEPETVMGEVRAIGKELKAILLTHGHFDHVGAVRELFAKTDCDIYLCPADCEMPESWTAGPLCYTNSYQEGDTVQIAGLSFKVLQLPGHTPGSVALQCGELLFVGDTLFAGSCGRTDLPLGDWDTLRKSLLRLKNMEEDFKILPGHGSATTLSMEKRYNPYLR